MADAIDAARSARVCASLLAIDPVGLGGVLLRSAAGPARDAWLAGLRALLPGGVPWRRVPSHIADDRLLGGLDLAATVQAGRAIGQRGVLAEADGGVVLLAMAERLEPALAARIAAVMEAQVVTLQRDGLALSHRARLAVVALDEGQGDDELVPAVLRERLGLHLRLDAGAGIEAALRGVSRPAIEAARGRLLDVRVDDAIVTALCEAAQALGIVSMRACCLALRAARASAALRGAEVVEAEDAAWAAHLVLGPRARAWPGSPAEPDANAGDDTAGDEAPQAPEQAGDPAQAGAPAQAASAEPADGAGPPPAAGEESSTPDDPLQDAVLEAAATSLPAALLAAVAAATAARLAPTAASAAGRSGAARRAPTHGRPIGSRRGEPRGGARLDLLQTLRVAAPWQVLRRREAPDARPGAILVRRDDLRIRAYRQRSESTTIFAVDASGSQAQDRLAEAKGAVELLLAECYVRRDRVALLAFRGSTAALLLPPTRSLVRAKRCLASLPGGGGTPLAAGIDAARELAQAIERQGGTALLVLLTDGRGNVGRDGRPGRVAAQEHALAAARAWRGAGLGALLLDTGRQGDARRLAQEMQAMYVALPQADAAAMARAVTARRA